MVIKYKKNYEQYSNIVLVNFNYSDYSTDKDINVKEH